MIRTFVPVVESLPTPRDREIVRRFYLDEEEKEAICRDLGLSPLHFDKVIFRARQRMRKLLEERGFKKTDFFRADGVFCMSTVRCRPFTQILSGMGRCEG